MKGGQNKMTNDCEAMLRMYEHRAEIDSASRKNDLVDRLKKYEDYLDTQIKKEKAKYFGQTHWERDSSEDMIIAYNSAKYKLYEIFSEIAPKKE